MLVSLGRTHKEVDAHAPQAGSARSRPAWHRRVPGLGLLARAAAVTVREVRQDGLVRTARRAARTAHLFGFSNAVRRAETAGGQWRWYLLDLSRNERRPLPPGVDLRRWQMADVPPFGELQPGALP